MSPKFMLVNRKLFLVLLFLIVLSAALQFGGLIINTTKPPKARKSDPRLERACGHVATQLKLAEAWAQHPDSVHDAVIMSSTLEGIRAICMESGLQPAKPMKLAP